MTDLREELARIADDVAAGPVPDDLWSRGVQRRRRTRVTSALAVATVVLLIMAAGVAGRDLLGRTPVQPAGQERAGALPDRLLTPSRWLAGTSGHPPGPVAVIAGAERADGWWGTTDGVVAVSATTGDYHFLDLPDAVDDLAADVLGDASLALSPGGGKVAYWTRHPKRASWVGGVAVYDTVTGEILRHELPSDLGVTPELLAWGGDGELVVGYGVVTDRRSDGWSSSSRAPFVWHPATDRVVELASYVGPPDAVVPTESGFAVVRRGRVELRSGAAAEVHRVVQVAGRPRATQVSLDPTVSTLVMAPQVDRNGVVRRLLVGSVGPVVPEEQDRVRMHPRSLDLEVLGLLGWQDPRHVVVRGIVPGTQRRRAGAYAVDLRTGEHRLLVREERASTGMFPVYADELWSRPTVEAIEPVAGDPRTAVAGGLVLAGVVATLALVRRRRRAG